MAQGCRRSRSIEKLSEILNRRMKAMRLPSGDQRGSASRSTLGDKKRICPDWGLKIPIKLWSPRFETNDNSEPSGDHSRAPTVPRISKNFRSLPPVNGAVQTLPSRE